MEVYTENCLMKEAFVTVVKNKVNIILHENAHKLFATMPFHDYLLLEHKTLVKTRLLLIENFLRIKFLITFMISYYLTFAHTYTLD